MTPAGSPFDWEWSADRWILEGERVEDLVASRRWIKNAKKLSLCDDAAPTVEQPEAASGVREYRFDPWSCRAPEDLVGVTAGYC